jgi:hypothetical protein
MYKKILLVCVMLLYSAFSLAQEQGGNAAAYPALNLHLSSQQYLQLAEADTSGSMSGSGSATNEMSGDEYDVSNYKDRWFTANKAHKWLGIGSLALATAAALAPKSEDGAHHELAQASVAVGALAVATGLTFHYEDLSAKNFFSNPDNLHAMLTSLGVLGYAIAVDRGGEGGHAGAGIAGAVFMIAGIKMTW